MRLVIWESNNELTQLEKDVNLTPVEFSYYNTISSEKRRREWLTSRLMVRNEIGENVSTVYIDRRPCLVSSTQHISISHSDNKVVLMVADTPCGVDIENATRDFSRVKNRFLSPEELSWMTTQDIALAWSIKEAAYKMIGVPDIDFATMFHIKKIDRENELATMSFNGVDYNLSFKSFEHYNIVYGEFSYE